MARSIKGIRENLEHMKKADNAWADRYARDVGWLLNRHQETVAALRGVAIMLNTELARYESEPWAQRVRAALALAQKET